LNFLLGISHHRQTSPRRLRSISPANGNGAALAGIRDLIDLLHVYPTMAEALKVEFRGTTIRQGFGAAPNRTFSNSTPPEMTQWRPITSSTK
jgi:hypothetical protein